MNRINILLADDDAAVRAGYGQRMRAEGWRVTLAADGFEAVQAARQGEYDVMLLDVRMPYRNGADVLRMLRAEDLVGKAQVILLAQPGDSDLVDHAAREGFDGIFDKTRMGPQDVKAELQVLLERAGRSFKTEAGREFNPETQTVPPEVMEIMERFRSTPDGRQRNQPAREAAPIPAPMPPAMPRASRTSFGAAAPSQRRSAPPPAPSRGQPRPPDPRDDPGYASRTYPAPARAPQAAPQPARPQPQQPAQPPAPAQPRQQPPPQQQQQAANRPFHTLLNRQVGEAVQLAKALGLPQDFSCPVCRSQLVLRLWREPRYEGGVTGQFFCPSCTSA